MRTATKADGKRVRFFVSRVLLELGFTLEPATTDADLNDIEESYLVPGGTFELLLNTNNRLVGTVGIARLDEQRCGLRKMYLSKCCRGQGLGRLLLETAIQRALALGFHRIELETAEFSLRRASTLRILWVQALHS